ncbi:MAG: transferase [Gammaproteobacteria bacterium HGW-Gammaproteobacteria-11]|nr:MAG: transferase [Gammaproteobacteria bacterium HGW-Gammaproteobacteria-11]
MLSSNKKPVVVFGATPLAELAAYLITEERQVLAHVVDDGYRTQTSLNGIPVLEISELPAACPPDSHELVVPLGFSRINGLRQQKCDELEAMGYTLSSYRHPSSQCWQGLQQQANTLIFEGVIVQPFVRIGRNVILRAGTNLGHHSTVGDHCFIASGVTTGGNVSIGQRCFIGLGAVLRDGVRIADRCFIGAGAVVISDTEEDGVYVGNPAKKMAKTSAEVTR